MAKPSMADHGHYLCQAYNYWGSIQSRIAELYILRAATIQFSVMANFSLNWFALDVDGNNTSEGSGSQSVNVTDHYFIQAALELALNSSGIKVKIDRVIDRPGGSEVKAKIRSICTNCSLVNHSLDTIENEVMDLNDGFISLVHYINNGIINSEFVVAASNNTFVRMQVVMATAPSNISVDCPQAMSTSDTHFFICGKHKHNFYFLDCTIKIKFIKKLCTINVECAENGVSIWGCKIY